MKIAIIGAGAMGSAVASGLLTSGMKPEALLLANPHTEKLATFASAGAYVTTDNVSAAKDADVVIIAVKPWVLPAVAFELKGVIDTERQEVTVIVAGIRGEEIRCMFDHLGKLPALSIAMPNTAAAICQSMTFIVPLNGRPERTSRLFESLGRVMTIDESHLPGAMALASCGIAYALRYIRAATEGGVQLGFRAAEAQEIVAQTVAGAAALLRQPGAHAETEIDRVTTPGGFTIRGLNAMEAAGFTPAVIAGLSSSVKN